VPSYWHNNSRVICFLMLLIDLLRIINISKAFNDEIRVISMEDETRCVHSVFKYFTNSPNFENSLSATAFSYSTTSSVLILHCNFLTTWVTAFQRRTRAVLLVKTEILWSYFTVVWKNRFGEWSDLWNTVLAIYRGHLNHETPVYLQNMRGTAEDAAASSRTGFKVMFRVGARG
jgi:hypothetical protein